MAIPRFEDTDPLFDDTTPLESQPTPQETGLEKAVRYSENVTGTLGKIVEPVTSRIGKALMAIKAKSDEAADKEAELSGQKGVLPISAMVPAIPSMLIDALGVPDRLGTAIAEKGGEYGVNPELAAAVGTGVSMAPDIAAGAAGIAKRGAIAESLKGVGRTATAPLRFAKDTITKPGAAEARLATQEAIEGIKETGASELAKRRGVASTAKDELIGAEENAGLHFKTSPEFETLLKDPKRVAKDVQVLSRLTEKGPEYLAQTLEPRELQSLRKFLQEAEKSSGLSDIAQSEMRTSKGILVKALERTTPEIVEPLRKLSKAERAVKEFPSELRKQVSGRRLQGAKDVLEGRKIDRRRKILRALAAAGAAGTGLGLFIR